MTHRPSGVVLPHLRRLLSDRGEPGDAQLLRRFLADRDEDAFAALVRRHGPMVLAVCRRLLPDPHDADDAFQATFLVLVRKAAALGRPERLGNWLYGVAYRTALKTRGRDARRRRRERPLADVAVGGDVADLVWRELRPTLDEELHRLPEKYRAPVVLCFLEGVSKREAARRLGWPEGTLSVRLHRARELLRGRLTRRGLALSAGAVALALSRGTAPAAVPAPLTAAAVATAALVAAGRAALVPAPVMTLTEGVLRAMWWNKVMTVSAALLAAGLLVAGLGGALLHAPAAARQPEAKVPPPAAPVAEAPRKKAGPDRTLVLGKDVTRVVWSPDGKLMASLATRSEKKKGGDEDARDWFSTIKVWDAATGKEIISFGEVPAAVPVGLGLAPDGSTLALSFRRRIEEGDKVELWDARKAELKKTIEMDYGRVAPKFVFAPDGKTLAVLYAGDTDRDPKADDLRGGVRLFDLATGKAIRSARGHKHMAISVAFSPDGKLLATGGYRSDLDVRLWDVATGKEVRVINVAAMVPALAFSPDGKVLAIGQDDSRVALRAVATGRQLRMLQEAPDRTEALAFSHDGRLLAAAGSVEKDNKRSFEARLWDVRTGELLRSWEDTATSLTFMPDGRHLAILGRDGAVRLWEVEAAPAAKADYGFGPLIEQLIAGQKNDAQAAEALYLAALGRFPADAERKTIVDHLAKKKDRREALLDVVWALINSKTYFARLDALNEHDPRKKR